MGKSRIETKALKELLIQKMLSNPQATDKELGEMLGRGPKTIFMWRQDPEWRAEFEKQAKKEVRLEKTTRQRVDEKILEATEKAIDKSVEFLDSNKKSPLEIQLETVKAVLSQGHAKAIERRATLGMSVELPPATVENLLEALKEMDKPFIPSRRLKQIEGENEVVEALTE